MSPERLDRKNKQQILREIKSDLKKERGLFWSGVFAVLVVMGLVWLHYLVTGF